MFLKEKNCEQNEKYDPEGQIEIFLEFTSILACLRLPKIQKKNVPNLYIRRREPKTILVVKY